MNGNKNLFLCGFMGCGKTSVGKRVAALLGRPFIDMDAFIEEREKRSVAQIFESGGEPAFRRMELEAARALSLPAGLVVATGGGAVLQPAAAAAMRRGGVLLLLDISLKTAQERLRGDSTRPLLRQPNREQAMAALFEERRPLYLASADALVPADASLGVVAKNVIKALKAFDMGGKTE